MAIKIHYQYRVYEGCDEATEMSKSWERTKSLGWSVWLGLGLGTLMGVGAIDQIITNSYDAESFWVGCITFIVTLLLAYSYVIRSKYVYPTCETLFLSSKKTDENSIEIEKEIQIIKQKRTESIKKAVLKFTGIYFCAFIFLLLF